MSSNDGDWVRQSTPRGADWEDDQSEYGTALEPGEWDDHATEQTVRVTRPEPRPRPASRAVPVIPPTPSSPISFTSPTNAEPPSETTTRIPVASPVEPESTGPAEPAVSEEPALEEAAAVVAEGPGESVAEPVAVEVAEDPVAEAHEVAETGIPEAAQTPEVVAQEQPRVYSEPEPATQPIAEAEAVTSAASPSPFSRPASGEPMHAQPVVDDEEPQAAHIESPSPEESLPTEAIATVPQAPEAPAVPAGLFRDEVGAEPTAVLPDAETTNVLASQPVATAPTPVPAAELDEERRVREQLAAERAARNEKLGVVETSTANEVRTPPVPVKRTTDKFLPSFGLFVLRLVVAGILAIIGYQGLTNIDGTAEVLGLTMLPEPRLLAWIGGFTLLGMALLLVIGLFQRVVGFVLLGLAVVSLVFLRWGAFSPFVAGEEGFIGDRDLLLATIGLLLICVGGGGWGIDGAFRRARAAAKAERQG